MIISFSSIKPFKGFELESSVEFDDYLCLVTGVNGSGKTRLLEAIKNGSIEVSIDDAIIEADRIRTLSMGERSCYLISNEKNINQSKYLSHGLYQKFFDKKNISELPDTEIISIHTNGIDYSWDEYKIKEIYMRAESLFNKKPHQLSAHELELSILVNKEIINGRKERHNVNLSQLTINYYQTFEKNEYLQFLNYKNQNTKFFSDAELKDLIGKESPSVIFNNIINEIFRGKFSITNPNSKSAYFEYTPNLIINATGEIITIDQLSAGEKIIYWLAERTVELIYSNPNNIFSDTSLILIDEPDAHLHPQMTEDLFKCINQLHHSLNVNFIFSTHSPTTVALSPNANIITLSFSNKSGKFIADKVDKDRAISELLDGISQISINPDNNRQVYVEGKNDHDIYEYIFRKIKNHSKKINKHINLSFLSSGEKITGNELRKHLSPFITEEEKITELIKNINGDGSCGMVVSMVNSLHDNGNYTVRGLVDWDTSGKSYNKYIKVFAKNRSYSIENVIYDPISIFAYHYKNDIEHDDFHFKDIEGKSWSDILNDDLILQSIIDKVILRVFKIENEKNHDISYMNGKTFKTDKKFYVNNGHDLETEILKAYPGIKELIRNKQSLMYRFLKRSTIAHLEWGFVNIVFEEAFVELQK